MNRWPDCHRRIACLRPTSLDQPIESLRAVERAVPAAAPMPRSPDSAVAPARGDWPPVNPACLNWSVNKSEHDKAVEHSVRQPVTQEQQWPGQQAADSAQGTLRCRVGSPRPFWLGLRVTVQIGLIARAMALRFPRLAKSRPLRIHLQRRGREHCAQRFRHSLEPFRDGDQMTAARYPLFLFSHPAVPV